MSYYPFTKEEREQARSVDLAEFLHRQGEKIKRSGSENMWRTGGQKVTLRGNLWFHQYEQVGGDAVDFACKFYGLTYPEAVKLLLGLNIPAAPVPQNPQEEKAFELPQANSNMARVYAYLVDQRGIDREVLDAFVFRKLIYESREFCNAVFVGMDPQGVPRHAHKHGTGKQDSYKGNVAGCVPEYSFHWVGGSEELYLFEAPIDLLAFISMHKTCWKNHSYGAACSVSDRVLWQMLRDYPHIRKVNLCFDSDAPGRRAAKRIAQKLESEQIPYAILLPKQKDWDEDLLQLRKEAL